MASTIKLKRSAVSGNAPTTSNIAAGELALNTADGILYSTDGSSVFEIGANLSSLAVSGQVTLSNIISANGSVGTAGQALLTDGSSKVYWGTVSGSGAVGSKETFYYTAGAGDTTFSGADDYSNVADLDTTYIDVFLNGILIANSNYTSNTTAVVFNSGLNNNDIVTIVASDIVAGELARTYVYSANGTQTVFSGTDLNSQTLTITSNFTDVYVNGLLIYDNTNNYTSNSSAVTFQTTPNQNDIITIKTYDIIPGRAALTGIDDNSTATTITIDTSNRVGISEATPAYNLDVGGSLGVNSLYIGDVQVTSTATELNVLDGITATTTELNYTDGVTSNIQTQLDAKAPLASPTFTGTVSGTNLSLSGDLTVNGTTTTLSTTNTVVSDNLIELNNGVAANANDSGIVIERGTTGDNAFMGWDESADSFILGTTTATGSSTGNLTITAAPLTVSALTADGLTVDTNTLYVDSTNNRVGVGTITPSADLTLATAKRARFYRADNTRYGDIFTDNNAFTIKSSTDPIIIDPAAGGTRFQNNGTEVVRIDSSGHLLVGMSTDAGNTVGVRARNDGLLTATRTASHSTIFGRKSSDGDISLFQKDGTTVGKIGSVAGVISYIVFDPRTSGSGLTGVGQAIRPIDETGAYDDAAITLGSSSYRFKDLYLSGTVNVGEAAIETATGSTSSTTQTAISTFAKATYTSGKFIIQVTDSTATEMMVTELLVVHDGTTASATQYGTIYTGSAALATFDVDISGTDVRILATAASTNSMAYKVTETLIKV